MNYQWARDTVLKLIDRYSTAGSVIALSYSDQADFVAKIPVLLDTAQTIAAATTGKMRKAETVSALSWEEMAGKRLYVLPEDCLRPILAEGMRLVDDGHIAVDCDGDGAILTYYRRPRLLGEDPAPETELDNTPEVQMALPYYAAAQLMLHEDTQAYRALRNEWEQHLSRIAALTGAELGITVDVYGEGGE